MSDPVFPALRKFVRILAEGWGRPRVRDEGDVRCLSFNEGIVQSSMRVDDPFALTLGYTRAMMGFLLFDDAPGHVLMVGLGGGSLQKFCYRELPGARITTLEIDPEVIALRDRFLIPPDDERFRVVEADAAAHLARGETQADVILVDGYNAAGLPENLCSEAFYTDCWRALGARGVLVCNLWGYETDRAVYIERLNGIFNGRVWWCRARDSRGLIVFAVKDANYYPHWARLMSKAQALDARVRLELMAVVNDMRGRPEPDSW
jgi:spermidine synthase